MLMRVISLLRILSLLTTSSSAAVGQESQQAATKMREIAMKAVEKGKAVTVTLKTARTDKKKYTGMLSNVRSKGPLWSKAVPGNSASSISTRFREFE